MGDIKLNKRDREALNLMAQGELLSIFPPRTPKESPRIYVGSHTVTMNMFVRWRDKDLIRIVKHGAIVDYEITADGCRAVQE